MTASSSTHYRGCTLCEAMCGLEIELSDQGEITSIRGDDADPLSRGHICPKAVALQDIHDDPDRLRQPVRRTASGDFEPISWNEAFGLVADGIRGVQERHGKQAMAAYLGNPNVHNYGSLLFGPALLRLLRTPNRFSATSVDQLPHHLAAYLMFGHMLLLPIPDLDRTDYLLVLGGNPAVSNGSLMTAPDVKKRLKAIRQRGGKMVVIDPRRTETAALADEHFFVRPGTDALLLAAMVRTVFEENLADPGRLADFTDGLDRVRTVLAPFSPEVVATECGVEAETIRRLAREFATADSAAAHGRMGLSTQELGGSCQWLLMVLHVITGNLDRAGGAMFTRPAFDPVRPGRGGGSYGRWKSRVRGLPEFAGELPVAALAEDMDTPGDGQIHGFLTVAGNPVLSTPNGRRLEAALGGLDFMASIDLYVNETTRHAHVILPPTSPLEHDHYDLVFHALAIRNTSRYSPPLFERPPGALHDWQIHLELQRRLDPKPGLRTRLTRFILGKLGPHGLLDLGLRFGPYGSGWRFLADGLSLMTLKRHPHGIDLGPLEPCLPARLRTPDRRIELAPELFLADLPRLEALLAEGAKAGADVGAGVGADVGAEPEAERSGQADTASDSPPLQLIGRRQVRSNNSWMHNYPRLMRGKDRCTLLLHPTDAAARGIDDGTRVRVRSRVGEIEVPVEISDEIMPGVVSLPHGWGHGRRGTRLATANDKPGASINDLTDEERIDTVSGNAAFSGVPVSVSPAGIPSSSQTPSSPEIRTTAEAAGG